jgi:multisubunit Na+/H+ antiporter MnhC subunit
MNLKKVSQGMGRREKGGLPGESAVATALMAAIVVAAIMLVAMVIAIAIVTVMVVVAMATGKQQHGSSERDARNTGQHDIDP